MDKRECDLKEEVDKLKSLLDDPQPGLMSWYACLDERMKSLIKMWTGGK